MDEFLGVYKKDGEWYAQVASTIGVCRQLGPFDTGVEAAIYRGKLSIRVHWYSNELNYPGGATYTSLGISGVFDFSTYDSHVLVYAEPRMRRCFQFRMPDTTAPKCWPPDGNVTSMTLRDATAPVLGTVVGPEPLTRLMQVVVSKTDSIRDP